MKVATERIRLQTKGNPDLIDITDRLNKVVFGAKIKNGSVNVFVVGSTAALTTFEYEPGLIQDVSQLYEKLIPAQKHYAHDETWGDANGFSHLRAALQGPSLTIPIEDGKMLLGTWQQVVLAEFDNRPRQREVVVQIIGEER